MTLSPLQLKHYHFTSVSVASRVGVDLSSLERVEGLYPIIDDKVNFRTDIELGEMEGDKNFALRVGVSGEPKEDSNFPYEFSATTEGVFEYIGEEDGDTMKRIVVINGAGLLYGAIRDQLMTLTARLNYGPMLLPSLDFRSLEPECQEATAAVASEQK
ncbi:protein-export chaperone SecB [Rhodocyclus tenuis]|uniref:Preprotein translocase subunit SecB n=1 Tax=Rhodocyclus tenuis TaxID=1066 RepID=A0A840G5M2_RHOTE|nr:protein-export chaperone SecB [Rhodocyclus tenuis]MBB4247673.1 preprotein translocase subunit SecB [Rhodocyclus tenuis]